MMEAEIGLYVWLTQSARRYHAGLARIVGHDRNYYVVERIGDVPGTGQRQFRVHRGEFELVKDMAEAASNESG